MPDRPATVEAYMAALAPDRVEAVTRLREVLKANLPEGFVEVIGYGMPSYVVPHTIYPAGYHCDPKLPLPFVSFASQKSHIALYHMGVYADPRLMEWLMAEFPKHTKAKIDMGKSCLRFKKPSDIPFDLMAELARKMTPAQWVALYESAFRKG